MEALEASVEDIIKTLKSKVIDVQVLEDLIIRTKALLKSAQSDGAPHDCGHSYDLYHTALNVCG